MKDLYINEFFGKLSALAGLQKRREAPKLAKDAKENNLALKMEKVLRFMHDEGSLSDKDANNADIALITKGMRRFWRGKGMGTNSGG